MNEYEYQTTEHDADHTTNTPTNPVKPAQGTGWKLVAAASYNHDAGGGVLTPRIQWYWERLIPPPPGSQGPQGAQGPQAQGAQGAQGPQQ